MPLALYVTFIYGTSIGLFLALAAAEQFFEYMEYSKIRTIILCTFFILFAQLFKNNYLIFLLGFIAVLIFDFFKKVNFRHIFLLEYCQLLYLCAVTPSQHLLGI